jgi:glycosyltransferase involved in cell wall biosynthesis
MVQCTAKSVTMTVGRYEESGIGNIVRNLSAELVLRGYNVSIGVRSKRDITTAVPAGCQVFYFTDHLFLSRVLGRTLGRILPVRDLKARFHPIIHHHQSTLILETLPFKERKVILHYHGVNPRFNDATMRVKYEAKQLTKFATKASALIAVSEFARTEMRELLNIHSPIEVIYPGVDTIRYHPEVPPKYRKGLPSLLFVGRLAKRKAVHRLIQAMTLVKKEFPAGFLRVIGSGPYKEALQQQIYKLGLSENIEIIPWVTLTELPLYYASCDAYVSSSAWETFGLPVLEAMASGKPVVGPSTGSYPEIIKASEAGEIYQGESIDECARTMIRVAMNTQTYSDKARAFALNHTWQRMVDDVEKIYRDLIPNANIRVPLS